MPVSPSLIQMVLHFILSDQTLFTNPELFEFDYMPDQVLFRESQLAELAFWIRSCMEGRQPAHAICRGPPGCGKTTSVKHLFTEIRAVESRLLPIYVNCQTDPTHYAIASRIYASVTGMNPPGRGWPTKKMMDIIADTILERESALIVCLDDIQYLMRHDSRDAVISSLIGMESEYPGCRAGVIMTTSDMQPDFPRIVDLPFSSTICSREIPFPPYTAEEIREILRLRVREGVLPGVISSGVLDLIVRETEVAGDLRVGIDLLKRSVLRAEREERGAVLREDILLAYGNFRLLHLKKKVQGLSEEERAILLRVHLLEERGGGGLISGELYGNLIEEEEIAYSIFMDRLENLADLGLIDLRVRQAKGRTDVIVPRYSREEVEGICTSWERGAHSLKEGAESKSFR